MGTGYVGYDVARPGGHPAVAYPQRKEQIREHGTALPLDWDEYHCGQANVRHWLGMPTAGPVRITDHLIRKELPGRRTHGSRYPGALALEVDSRYEARILKYAQDGSVHIEIEEVLPWHNTGFKIRLVYPRLELTKDREYTVRFTVSAPSPYGRIDPKYATIPRNLEVRLSVGKSVGRPQEALVFAEPRQIHLTLTAPESGTGRLEFGLAEEPGEITLSDVELYEGCADLMVRRFQHGLVLLNGSASSPFTFPLGELFSGESYRRIKGQQDPEHNSGAPIGKQLTLGPRDGILLLRVEKPFP